MCQIRQTDRHASKHFDIFQNGDVCSSGKRDWENDNSVFRQPPCDSWPRNSCPGVPGGGEVTVGQARTGQNKIGREAGGSLKLECLFSFGFFTSQTRERKNKQNLQVHMEVDVKYFHIHYHPVASIFEYPVLGDG